MQQDIFAGLDSASGKTSQEPSAQTADETLLKWLALWLEPGSVYRETDGERPELLSDKTDLSSGACWTRNTCEWNHSLVPSRNADAVCSLSSILETGPVDPPILLEPESLRGNPPPRREAGEEVADQPRVGAEERGDPGQAGRGAIPQVAGTIKACAGKSGTPNGAEEADRLIPAVANPLTHRMHKGINTTLDEGQTPIPIQNATRGEAQNGLGVGGDVSFTLDTASQHGVAQPVAFHNRQDPDISGDVTHPLGSMDNGMAIAFKPGQSEKAGGVFLTEGFSPTLQGQNNGSTAVPAFQQGMAVRRLTPVECERLQGFPDNFTRIPWRNKPAQHCPDGPRYRALGNSMAVNVMDWLGQRIQMVEEIGK